MSRYMSFILTACTVFAGIVLLAWIFQRTLIYFPFGNVPGPREVGLTRVEVVGCVQSFSHFQNGVPRSESLRSCSALLRRL